MTSSVYDPLGFIAPFVLPAKLILQDLCKKKLDWDDLIPEDDLKRWQTWLDELPKLEQFHIERCFKPRDFGEVVLHQLHIFSDASQLAYGSAVYLRMVNVRGEVHCSFVMGKSRLAPLKPITIPRMELSAAVLSTRLDKMIREAGRGMPKEIRSDNGGNFVKAEKDLREAVRGWNQETIHTFLLAKNIRWIFNPPAGSHHGGVWERCIPTVRKVMKALLKEQPKDDGLVRSTASVLVRPIDKIVLLEAAST